MSSEMRELVIRALQSAYAHGEKHAPFALHDCARQIVDAALLARTEAGADGVSIWRYRFRNSETGGWHEWRYSDRQPVLNSLVADKTEIQGPFTHPQDASGDAEVLTAHGIKALDRCCGELRKFIELAGDYDLDEMSVQALGTAIESMEMRKAAAMQAKEAK